MPRKRRRQPKARASRWSTLSFSSLHDLVVFGWRPPRSEFERNQADRPRTLAEAREAWETVREDSFFDQFFPDRADDDVSFTPGDRPAAWWQFSTPGRKREDESDVEALERWGLLTEREREALAEDTHTFGHVDPRKVGRGHGDRVIDPAELTDEERGAPIAAFERKKRRTA